MTILNERIVLDTNIWIFGLWHHPQVPACVRLLDRLGQLHVVLPRQVLKELQANLSRGELATLFRLLKHPGSNPSSLEQSRPGNHPQVSTAWL